MSNHWVPFYMGDYEKDTMALTMVQDAAYFRLLRYVWSTGESIPDLETAYVIVRASNECERNATAFVLHKYFQQKQGNFFNKKAMEILKKQNEKASKASQAAQKRWHANAYADAYPKAMLPEPDPNSSPAEKIPPTPRGESEGFRKFWENYPKKTTKKPSSEYWAKQKLDSVLPQVLEGLEAWKISDQWTKNAGQFIPDPIRWLKGERWIDSPARAVPFASSTTTRLDGRNIVPGHLREGREGKL